MLLYSTFTLFISYSFIPCEQVKSPHENITFLTVKFFFCLRAYACYYFFNSCNIPSSGIS